VTERALGWWVMASIALHMVGVAAGSLGRPSMDIVRGAAVAIEVVRIPTPEPPPAPPPPRVKAVLPRIVQRDPLPKPVEAPQLTPNLLDAPAPPAATLPRMDSTLVPSALPSLSAPVVGAPAGAGALFATGDLLVAPGTSGSAGSGASGVRGQGLASAGVASSQIAATGTGLTSLARPLGGYQVKPDYPERARKDGAEGTTTLKVEVLANGRVGEVVVARSAGRADLDRAAIEAVKQWHFEPARRGATAVPVWATLPVRFVLSEQ
jgi:periplasmic protein TonB